VATAVLGGDEELDDVQESTAMMTVCGAEILASCNDERGRLEFCRAPVSTERRLAPELQRDLAMELLPGVSGDQGGTGGEA
jgi:hypothetical protein